MKKTLKSLSYPQRWMSSFTDWWSYLQWGRSSRTSRSSSFKRWRSLVVRLLSLSLTPKSRSYWRPQALSVSGLRPILGAVDLKTACSDLYSLRGSRRILTARLTQFGWITVCWFWCHRVSFHSAFSLQDPQVGSDCPAALLQWMKHRELGILPYLKKSKRCLMLMRD